MADAMPYDLAKKLGSIAAQLALEEIKLLLEVDDEVRKLERNFPKVQMMLNKAEERKLTDQAVKLWYDELKDAYYMMDDVLDSWKTAKIKSQIQKQEEESDGNAPALEKKKKKVSSYLPSPSCFCFCQADKLSLRHEIGHKIKTLNETLDKIINEKQAFGIDLNSQSKVPEQLETTSFRDESKIIGRDEYMTDLLKNLLDVDSQEKSNFRVISLVGMSGIGKTTLALLAFNHPQVKARFPVKKWISVPNPFDQRELAQTIIQELDPTKLPNNNLKLQTLLTTICDLIVEKGKFFFVLDGLWTEQFEMWEPFKSALKCGAQGSRILVTTQNANVAIMMESSIKISLELLTSDECWLIIKKWAFPNDNEEQCSLDVESVGKKLANKCKGLPLAAKTLGSHMCGKRSEEEWRTVLESSLWDLGKVLLGPLLLSYYELSLDEKQCFLYCAVFPKDHPFDRFELVIHWMAQGYINSNPDEDMERKAGQYFENLAMRSFFQDFEMDNDGRIIRCKMHDIVHEFAKEMTKDVCFTIDSDNKGEKDIQRALQLSLVVKKTVPMYLSNMQNLRFLKLIFLSPQTFQPKLFVNLTCLRTLHLKVESIMHLPSEVEKLIHLRYLKLSCFSITELPDTICNLCNLQSLDVSECSSLKKLPLGMGKLINLRHFSLSKEPIVFPKGIGKLTSLKTISDFNIGGENDQEGCKLGELKNLNQLRGTLRIHMLKNVDVGEAENAPLKTKDHLCSLELDFGFVHEREEEEHRRRMKNDVLVLNALKPNPILESLTISCYNGTTESLNWMISLNKLKLLDLNCCYNLECLPPLGKLQVLESLCIRGAENVTRVGDEFLGIEFEIKNKKEDIIFPKLKSLEFEYLKNWEEWTGMGGTRTEEEKDNDFDPKIMPCLHSLSIMGCPKLKTLPDFLPTITLKDLQIHRSPILEQRCIPRK